MNDDAGGETGGSRRKSKDDESRIPVPNPRVFRRSASLRLRGERSSPRSFPEPIAEGGQSCAKIWPGRPSGRYRSQVTWVNFSSPFHHRNICCFEFRQWIQKQFYSLRGPRSVFSAGSQDSEKCGWLWACVRLFNIYSDQYRQGVENILFLLHLKVIRTFHPLMQTSCMPVWP
jgi:hypothetical protein